jgi:hypothetical protein
MHRQIGWEGFIENIKHESPYLAKAIPQWPRLFTRALENAARRPDDNDTLKLLLQVTERQGRSIRTLAVLVFIMAALWGAELVWLWRH